MATRQALPKKSPNQTASLHAPSRTRERLCTRVFWDSFRYSSSDPRVCTLSMCAQPADRSRCDIARHRGPHTPCARCHPARRDDHRRPIHLQPFDRRSVPRRWLTPFSPHLDLKTGQIVFLHGYRNTNFHWRNIAACSYTENDCCAHRYDLNSRYVSTCLGCLLLYRVLRAKVEKYLMMEAKESPVAQCSTRGSKYRIYLGMRGVLQSAV